MLFYQFFFVLFCFHTYSIDFYLDNLPSADANNNNTNNNNDTYDRHNETNTDENGKQPNASAAKKKHTRKAVSTVTTNKNTLCSRLVVDKMPDCLLFQLNSIMGETSSSNKLLSNLLQTKVSDLKMTLDDKFWDSKSHEPIEFSDHYEVHESDYIHINAEIKWNAFSQLTLRQQLKGYIISNTPMDNDEK